jgi:hypothetical protein
MAATRAREDAQVGRGCAPRSEMEDYVAEKQEARRRAQRTTSDVFGALVSDLGRALIRGCTQRQAPVAERGLKGPTPRPSSSAAPTTPEGVCSTCRVYREACGAAYCPLPPAPPVLATSSPITTGRLDDWPEPIWPRPAGSTPRPRPARRTSPGRVEPLRFTRGGSRQYRIGDKLGVCRSAIVGRPRDALVTQRRLPRSADALWAPYGAAWSGQRVGSRLILGSEHHPTPGRCSATAAGLPCDPWPRNAAQTATDCLNRLRDVGGRMDRLAVDRGDRAVDGEGIDAPPRAFPKSRMGGTARASLVSPLVGGRSRARGVRVGHHGRVEQGRKEERWGGPRYG